MGAKPSCAKEVDQQASPPAGKEDIRDKYEVGEVLGSGSYGQVRQATVKETGAIRAVKILERQNPACTNEQWSNQAIFHREVKILQGLNHPNVVRFFDFYEDAHFLYVSMELCKGGEVFNKILELKRFSEADAATVTKQMCTAIDHIHKAQIMHRDVKAENFLLSDSSPTSAVKMIDFGMAVRFEHGQTFQDLCGSPHYLAPELIGRKYGPEVDLWALGVLVYLMMYGRYPFSGPTPEKIVSKILYEPVKWPKVAVSAEGVVFMKRLLTGNPRLRMTAEETTQHAWITQAKPPDAPELPKEELRSTVRRTTLQRQQVPADVEEARNQKLQKIDSDFKKGIRHGQRLGETPVEAFMSKPEFVRRANKTVTAPSQQSTPQLDKLMIQVGAAANAAVAVVSGAAESAASNFRRAGRVGSVQSNALAAFTNMIPIDESHSLNASGSGAASPATPKSPLKSPVASALLQTGRQLFANRRSRRAQTNMVEVPEETQADLSKRFQAFKMSERSERSELPDEKREERQDEATMTLQNISLEHGDETTTLELPGCADEEKVPWEESSRAPSKSHALGRASREVTSVSEQSDQEKDSSELEKIPDKPGKPNKPDPEGSPEPEALPESGGDSKPDPQASAPKAKPRPYKRRLPITRVAG